MPVDWNAHCRNKKAETAAPDPWLVKILPLLPVGARKDLQRSDFLRQRLPTALASPARNRVGGGVAPAVLPHHRAYGSVHGGSRGVLKASELVT